MKNENNSLTVEQVAPYLPYKLKVETHIGLLELTELDCASPYKAWFRTKPYPESNYNTKILSQKGLVGRGFTLNQIKPILRPLSDLEKTIEHNLDVFIPIERLRCKYNYPTLKGFEFNNGYGSVEANLQTWQTIGFCIFQQLFEWHFDVFGLIDQGLAVDINTL